jgi:glyoxylase I family protein
MSQPPFSLVGIDHVVFIVADMALAMEFYARVLGCVPGYTYPPRWGWSRSGAGQR